MARFERFSDLHGLDDAALRRFLEGGGDAPERVWAAWELALRGPATAGAILDRAAPLEPSAGVRAHLALLLVAHGELTAATTLALHDPAPLVRGSACRCLARLAERADEALSATITAALCDPSSEVRAAVIDGLRADAPTPLRRSVEACLDDTSLDVRAAAVEYLLRADGVSRALQARAPRETDAALFGAIIGAWRAAEGGRAVIGEAASWPTPAVVRILELGLAAEVETSELEGWLARDAAEIDAHLSALDGPIRWLLTFVVRLARLPDDPWSRERSLRWEGAIRSSERLVALLGAASSADLGHEERRLIRELADRIERSAREVYPEGPPAELALKWASRELSPDDDDDDGDDLPWVPGIELLPALLRLVAGFTAP